MVGYIGLIIGCYVITRMVQLIAQKDEQSESLLTQSFAVLTILATVVCLYALVQAGRNADPSLKPLVTVSLPGG